LFQEKYRGEKACDNRKGNVVVVVAVVVVAVVVVDDDDDDDDDFDRTVLSQWFRIPWYNFQTIGQHCGPGNGK
jgi:hypothetical protein